MGCGACVEDHTGGGNGGAPAGPAGGARAARLRDAGLRRRRHTRADRRDPLARRQAGVHRGHQRRRRRGGRRDHGRRQHARDPLHGRERCPGSGRARRLRRAELRQRDRVRRRHRRTRRPGRRHQRVLRAPVHRARRAHRDLREQLLGLGPERRAARWSDCSRAATPRPGRRSSTRPRPACARWGRWAARGARPARISEAGVVVGNAQLEGAAAGRPRPCVRLRRPRREARGCAT